LPLAATHFVRPRGVSPRKESPLNGSFADLDSPRLRASGKMGVSSFPLRESLAMKTDELRQKYLDFFVSKGHKLCPSDVLVPTWDPSVLFTPAGMNQFKDHFLGKVKLEFTRATSCQKCLRTGDIDNVGRTAYHHTFFEMLGNFSFGDYFKRDAIHWAWEFLTSKKWLAIDPNRLTVTVYLDDDEAATIWHNDIGLSLDRIERMDENDNFWPAGAPTQGPDGVCGPCSEIFFHPPGGKSVEIWNLVFTQFNRVGDPPNNLQPLPSKNIDTGMGLERCAATLQGVDTNFHIDILKPIVLAAADVCHVKYEPDSDAGRRLRRIADHVRACAMAVHENVYPGPQKEKYVIRRLLRRAVLDGHQMGQHEPFLFRIVPTVVEMMRVPYPDLTETTSRVMDVIRNEESNFFGTIDAGLARVDRIFQDMLKAGRTTVDGVEAADLYQTFGVPAELLESLAADRKFGFDWPGFRTAMLQHGEVSGKVAHAVMSARGPVDTVKQTLGSCTFLGYDTTEAECELRFIVAGDELHDAWSAIGSAHPAVLILDQTPFYAESGGQVGDTGFILGDGFRFRVEDTQRDSGLILHRGFLEQGVIRTNQKIRAEVDKVRRKGIQRAHSATHILHYALQKNLGTHAQQQGSKVDDDWLRFDFTNLAPVKEEEILAIERDVRERVQEAAPVRCQIVPLAEARAAGAMMLFGEKYPDPVRMVSMGGFSKELCGGTHLDNTADVDAFELLSEEGVAAGTRRVTAITGSKARDFAGKLATVAEELTCLLQVSPAGVVDAVQELSERTKQLKKAIASGGKISSPPAKGKVSSGGNKEAESLRVWTKHAARLLNVGLFETPARVRALLQDEIQLKKELEAASQHEQVSIDALLESARKMGAATVVVQEVPGSNPGALRQLIDQFRQKAPEGAILLATSQGVDKVTLIAAVSSGLVKRGLHAGNWVRDAALVIGGSGGGRPDMAQAGGKDATRLPEALSKALEAITKQLA
jgi:alanyl-tRNA synthetase